MEATITSPDALLTADPDSMAFFVLRNEQLVICKSHTEVPYHKDRSTYLSSGRYSAELKKVIFWPEPINPQRAINLLTESGHITSDFTYMVSGVATKVNLTTKTKGPVDRLTGVKKAGVDHLINRGMRIQKSVEESPIEDHS